MYPYLYIKDENISYPHLHKTYCLYSWQTVELSWTTTTRKVTWPWDHLTIWSHVTNKNRYISTSPKAMTVKLGKVEINNKKPPSLKFFDALTRWSSDQMTDKKRYISTSAKTMAKKLGRLVGSNAGLLSIKSHKLWIKWSHKVKKMLKTHFHVTYNYQTWQKDCLWLGITCLTTKSHIPLTMWLREGMWQMNFIIFILRSLLPLNLTGWWLVKLISSTTV